MGTLLLVATPIGNLEDVTPRALRALAAADLLLAEDTRRTRILLDRYAVKAKPVSLHAHNEVARIERALSILEDGGEVVLVSDAGTPVISDPGERLVAAAIAAGHRISIAPGPSAVPSALAVSGLPPIPFTFVGFLPRRPRNGTHCSKTSRVAATLSSSSNLRAAWSPRCASWRRFSAIGAPAWRGNSRSGMKRWCTVRCSSLQSTSWTRCGAR